MLLYTLFLHNNKHEFPDFEYAKAYEQAKTELKWQAKEAVESQEEINSYAGQLADMDAKLTAMTARRYREHIVGIKLAHYSGPEWDPVDNLVKAGLPFLK